MKFSYKVQVLLAAKMAVFAESLELLFPTAKTPSLGEKLDSLNKNLFINAFLYRILDEMPNAKDQEIMRAHFRLDDEFQRDEEK